MLFGGEAQTLQTFHGAYDFLLARRVGHLEGESVCSIPENPPLDTYILGQSMGISTNQQRIYFFCRVSKIGNVL